MSSTSEINNKFKDAINTVANSLSNIGIDINIDNYDGIIIKKLRPSNTLDEDRENTNQSHIAITGEQMNMFPYLKSDGYFNVDSSDDSLKKYFVLSVPIYLDEINIAYLNNVELPNESNKIESYSTILRTKRKNQADQIQLSIKKHDDEKFVSFRKLLHEDYYLVLLKIKEEFKYEAYGIKPNDSNDSFDNLKNKFYHLVTETVISTDYVDNNSSVERISNGRNILFYGVPGSGKSRTIQDNYCDDELHMERVVFHPDYTYSDFIGQVLPKVENGDITYEFTPGPFTLILEQAEKHPKEKFFLIIEEINRGNAPAIFGDIFQLLDRKQNYKDNNDDGYPIGTSEYGITNSEVADIVYEDKNHKVRIPSNLTIIGTMNTSDQNVFTLDTAFQRRWEMKMVENSFDGVKKEFKEIKIDKTTVSWETFCTRINEIILEKNIFNTSSEDKRLGVYFVNSMDLKDSEKFSEKVLKYLWDDAFKLSREDIFDVSQHNSLESVIKTFNSSNNNDKFNVFKQGVRDKLLRDSDNENNLGEQ